MLTNQVLEEVTLRVGAYPHRFSDRLGAELEMTLREGSREQFECGEESAAPTRPLSAKAHSDERKDGRPDRGWWRLDRATLNGRLRGRSPPEPRLVFQTGWQKWSMTWAAASRLA